MKATPYQLKNGDWGIRTVPAVELERGNVIDVEKRDGSSYRVEIRTKVFSVQDEQSGKDFALYAVNRLPEIQGNTCPLCGQAVTKERQDGATQRKFVDGNGKAGLPSQEFDPDDIPF